MWLIPLRPYLEEHGPSRSITSFIPIRSVRRAELVLPPWGEDVVRALPPLQASSARPKAEPTPTRPSRRPRGRRPRPKRGRRPSVPAPPLIGGLEGGYGTLRMRGPSRNRAEKEKDPSPLRVGAQELWILNDLSH